MGPERDAQVAVVVVTSLLVIWFFFKGIGTEKRSLSLANLAMACGLCVLMPQRQLLPEGGTSSSALLLGAQLMMLVIGVIGLVLAVVALRARTSDGGTGVIRPVIASLLSLVLATSSGSVAMMSWRLSPMNNQPWEWISAKYNYRMRLPSSSCVESRMKDMEDVDGAFNCREQRMHVMVSARRASAAGYAAAVEEMRASGLGSNSRAPVLETTSTEAGWPCTRKILVEPANGEHGPLLVSVALIHWPENGLLFTVVLEGDLWTSSEVNTAMLREHLTRSAQQLQLSLGPSAGGEGA
ncbi:hypothetical protein [Hyalangium versicolor]|uniref:hypothetical protein n=1 Tax=Hyalangium versicolor TaxID=2861190 RepID=UPI001CC94BAD|nr:hypothetical protein [Hyalangium versicolor]